MGRFNRQSFANTNIKTTMHMKKNGFLLILLFCFSLMSTPFYAQNKGDFKLGIQGEVVMGTNNFSSPGGGAILDFKYFIIDKLALTFTTAWQAVSVEKAIMYGIGEVTVISGNIPLLVGAEYYFLKDRKVKPYIGVGVGAAFGRSSMEYEGGYGYLNMTLSDWLMDINEKIGCEFSVHEKVDVFAEINCNQLLFGEFTDKINMSFGLGARVKF